MLRQATELSDGVTGEEGTGHTEGTDAGEQCHPVEAETEEIANHDDEEQDAEAEEEMYC